MLTEYRVRFLLGVTTLVIILFLAYYQSREIPSIVNHNLENKVIIKQSISKNDEYSKIKDIPSSHIVFKNKNKESNILILKHSSPLDINSEELERIEVTQGLQNTPRSIQVPIKNDMRESIISHISVNSPLSQYNTNIDSEELESIEITQGLQKIPQNIQVPLQSDMFIGIE